MNPRPAHPAGPDPAVFPASALDQLLAAIGRRRAEDIGAVRAVTEQAAADMGRAMPELDLRDLLTGPESRSWRRSPPLLHHTLEPVLRSHEFFAGLEPAHLSLLAGCGSTVTFPADSYLFHEGDPAQAFYLIRQGRVALEVATPGRGALVVQTLGEGDVAGFSWLLKPHRWEFDGRAIERVLAVRMDGICLRGRCEQDARLGYELMRRFAGLATNRLQATRLQLLDVYGHAHDG